MNSIQKLLTTEECAKILKRSLGFSVEVISYKIVKYHEHVAGYLGDHLSLTIKYSSNGTIFQTSFFLKTLPIFNPSQLDYVVESGIFKKEVLLYQNLLRELLAIAKFGPACYFVKDEVIVLEDLRAKGYNMLSKDLFLDEDYCFATLKTLASYHASTLVYEKREGFKLDQKFKEELKETCFNFLEGQPRQKWMISTTKCVTDLMRLCGLKDFDTEKICDKFEKFVFGELEGFLAPSKKYRNVLTHDDLWCNNLLFNDQKECLFVDFQLVRYAPPALDFLVTLYLNIDCHYIDNNLKNYVDAYYKFFGDQLKLHGLSCDELPRSEFEESLEIYKLAALTENVMYGTHIYISEELSNEIVDDLSKYNEFSFINRSKFGIREFRFNRRYRERMYSVLTLLAKTLANRN